MRTHDQGATGKGPSKAQLHAAARAAAKARAKLAEDVERLCSDAGVSLAALARKAGVAYPHLWRLMAGTAKPSLETYAKLAVPLGADLSARLYPNTGPTIRDRHQARILEWLLGALHPRWQVFTEVPVRHPARGSIDVVLHEQRANLVVATEIESELRRLEQQVRWSQEKAAALSSWPGWAGLGEGGSAGDEPAISRLLLVRRTRATRTVAMDFGRQLAVAYPAHPDDAMAALAGTAPWPGPAMVWVIGDGKGVRFVPGR